MHFTKIKISNVVIELDCDGAQRSLIIVGENGTRKSVLLSILLDALVKMKREVYKKHLEEMRVVLDHNEDIFEQDRFRIKTDNMGDDVELELEISQGITVEIKNNKIETPYIHQNCYDELLKHVLCFFPANRFELPHWSKFAWQDRVPSKKIKYKGIPLPTYVGSSIDDTIQWIIRHMLRVGAIFRLKEKNKDPTEDNIIVPEETNNPEFWQQYKLLKRIEDILSIILLDQEERKEEDVILEYQEAPYDVKIIVHNKETRETIKEIMSLKHLSSGQSSLLSLFSTILRYDEHNKEKIPINTHEITGICIIDEIDAHLHSDLQYRALPELIKMFPKIQFIISTHSPLFILGMRDCIESDNFQLIEMLKGEKIDIERFGEFKKSYEYFRNTKKFEEDLKNSEKDIILLVEGETDKMILESAWKKIKNKEEREFDILLLYGANLISPNFLDEKIFKKIPTSYSSVC